MNHRTEPLSSDACLPFEISISAMIDGELPMPQRQELDDHLSTCEQCRTLASQFEVVNAAVYSMSDCPSLNPNLNTQAEPLPATGRLARWGSLALAAAIAVCLVVVIWPSDKPVEANQISPQQFIQPIEDLHQISLQRQKDQDLLLQTLEMSLMLLQVDLESLDPSDPRRQPMADKINEMLDRIQESQYESATQLTSLSGV